MGLFSAARRVVEIRGRKRTQGPVPSTDPFQAPEDGPLETVEKRCVETPCPETEAVEAKMVELRTADNEVQAEAPAVDRAGRILECLEAAELHGMLRAEIAECIGEHPQSVYTTLKRLEKQERVVSQQTPGERAARWFAADA